MVKIKILCSAPHGLLLRWCFARTGLLPLPILGNCFCCKACAVPHGLYVFRFVEFALIKNLCLPYGLLPLPIFRITPYVMHYFARSGQHRSRGGLKVTPGGKMAKAPLPPLSPPGFTLRIPSCPLSIKCECVSFCCCPFIELVRRLPIIGSLVWVLGWFLAAP